MHNFDFMLKLNVPCQSICNDEQVLARNYELKLQNDDYKGMDMKQARCAYQRVDISNGPMHDLMNFLRADFIERVRAYEKVYETIEDDEDNGHISYIQLINVGQKIITRNCHGYLPSQVAFYLQNVHILPR